MVVISNGFSKVHLSLAAAEANRRGLLTAFLTGAYPTPPLRALLALPGLRSNKKLNRLIARGEQIDDTLVRALFFPELVHQIGRRFKNFAMILSALRMYSRAVIPQVSRASADGARIYHYMSGFGGDSVTVAKDLGLVALCDHAAVHPAVVEEFVGRLGRMREFWRKDVQRDLENADAVLVNSAFVESTFKLAGFDCSKVHVNYLGVDDAFLRQIPQREGRGEGDLRLLFAGHFNKWKGADIIIDALRRLEGLPWRFEIAGRLHPQIVMENPSFFSDPRVRTLGFLSRNQLATVMSRADVLLFPSRAEGSARVVFEALACGCYVVTTPNSGSIVKDGVHGSLVPPGDILAVAGAIEDAHRDRQRTAEIGRQNADLVRSKYRQCDYGDKLESLYKKLLGNERKKDVPAC